MPVQVLCPNPDCGASYSVVDDHLGKLGRCKKCGTKFPLVSRTGGGGPPMSATDLDPAPRSAETELPSPFGHYEILRTLGRGGMGAVYLALDTRLERRVALKVPHREFAHDPGIRQRFLREARAAARFHHPNFCPIHEIGEIDGLPYLTMAYVEGGTLASKLERGRPWDQRRAAEVVRVLALALAEAHRQGVVHRDLKPANVMIDGRGNLVIMDFGLARRFEADDPTLTASGAVLGTPGYMPPEQAEGHSGRVGPRSDVYSLGVILYELISGHRPFEGSVARVLAMILMVPPAAPSSLHPGVDPLLESICLKAMAKPIEDRYPSMDAFAEALDDFLKSPPGPAPIVPPKPADLGHQSISLIDGNGAIAKSRSAAGSPPGRPWIVAAAAAWVAALLILGVIIYVSTDKGRIRIELEDPNAVVRIDGQQVLIEGLGEPITLRAGEHELSVKRGDGEFETQKFVIRRGDNPTLSVEFKPIPPKAIARVGPSPVVPPKPDDGEITNSIGMKLKLIPAGEFLMGSDASDPDAEDDEKVIGKKHPVRITRPFYLGATEVTVGQFRQFVEEVNYKTEAERDGTGGYGWDATKGSFEKDPKYTWRSPGFPQEDDHPVVIVSWNDAVAFCDWLSTGKEEGRIYRLPTEAEWEYACRAGQTTRYWSGDDPESLAAIGNVADETARQMFPNWTYAIKARDGHVFTAPVGLFRPNAFGLHEMHGNVWEWCADWYASDYYAKSPAADPLNSSTGTERVYRGGDCRSDPRHARSAYRNRRNPEYRSGILGFRVARVP